MLLYSTCQNNVGATHYGRIVLIIPLNNITFRYDLRYGINYDIYNNRSNINTRKVFYQFISYGKTHRNVTCDSLYVCREMELHLYKDAFLILIFLCVNDPRFTFISFNFKKEVSSVCLCALELASNHS